MTKKELLDENVKLKERIEQLQKELDSNWLGTEHRVLSEINSLLVTHISFYQTLLLNLTKKEDEEVNRYE